VISLITYERIHHYSFSQQSGQTSVSIQLQKAVSQSNYAFALPIVSANILDVTVDSFNADTFNTTEYQYRLGATYFPNQSIKDTLTDGIESYLQAAMTYDKIKHVYAENAVSLADYNSGLGVLAVSLEKDSSMALSGMPVNNSRVLELDATFASAPQAREIFVYMNYTSVCKSYVDNTAVAI